MPGKTDQAATRALLDPDGIFPQRLAADRAALAGLAADLWEIRSEALETRLREIATLAHRLGGAAGTFGYHAIGQSALELEDEILSRRPHLSSPAWRTALQPAIDSLVRALDDGLAER